MTPDTIPTVAVVCLTPTCEDRFRRTEIRGERAADDMLIFRLRCPRCGMTRFLEQG